MTQPSDQTKLSSNSPPTLLPLPVPHWSLVPFLLLAVVVCSLSLAINETCSKFVHKWLHLWKLKCDSVSVIQSTLSLISGALLTATVCKKTSGSKADVVSDHG